MIELSRRVTTGQRERFVIHYPELIRRLDRGGKTPLNVPQDRRRGLERRSGAVVWLGEPAGGRPGAGGPVVAWRLDQRRDRRGVRAEEALRAKVRRVREDTVRGWRSAFMRGGLSGIERHPAPGCPPVKAQAALGVAASCSPRRRPIARTGPCRGSATRSSGARASASRIRGSRRCCAKRGLCLQAAPSHAEGPSGRRCRRSPRLASSIARAAGAGGRHRAAVRRWNRRR